MVSFCRRDIVRPSLEGGPTFSWSASILAATAFMTAASAQPAAAAPDFSAAGWNTPIAGDFMPVPGAPAPVLSDPHYPFCNNVEANARGLMQEHLRSLLRLACKRTKPFGGSAVLGACLIGRCDLEQQSLIERSS